MQSNFNKAQAIIKRAMYDCDDVYWTEVEDALQKLDKKHNYKVELMYEHHHGERFRCYKHIATIKQHRDLTGDGLKVSKTTVEKELEKRGWDRHKLFYDTVCERWVEIRVL